VIGRMCRISCRIMIIRIDANRFVESPESIFLPRYPGLYLLHARERVKARVKSKN
jgi:hypothetical protein